MHTCKRRKRTEKKKKEIKEKGKRQRERERERGGKRTEGSVCVFTHRARAKLQSGSKSMWHSLSV
jgi:hypothetical protein